MMKRVALAAVLALGAAAPAFAQQAFTAELATPVAKPYVDVIDGAEWRCDGAHCTTTSDTSNSAAGGSCRQLARAVGPISSFNDPRPMTAAKLAQCNQAAPKRPAAS